MEEVPAESINPNDPLPPEGSETTSSEVDPTEYEPKLVFNPRPPSEFTGDDANADVADADVIDVDGDEPMADAPKGKEAVPIPATLAPPIQSVSGDQEATSSRLEQVDEGGDAMQIDAPTSGRPRPKPSAVERHRVRRDEAIRQYESEKRRAKRSTTGHAQSRGREQHRSQPQASSSRVHHSNVKQTTTTTKRARSAPSSRNSAETQKKTTSVSSRSKPHQSEEAKLVSQIYQRDWSQGIPYEAIPKVTEEMRQHRRDQKEREKLPQYSVMTSEDEEGEISRASPEYKTPEVPPEPQVPVDGLMQTEYTEPQSPVLTPGTYDLPSGEVTPMATSAEEGEYPLPETPPRRHGRSRSQSPNEERRRHREVSNRHRTSRPETSFSLRDQIETQKMLIAALSSKMKEKMSGGDLRKTTIIQHQILDAQRYLETLQKSDRSRHRSDAPPSKYAKAKGPVDATTIKDLDFSTPTKAMKSMDRIAAEAHTRDWSGSDTWKYARRCITETSEDHLPGGALIRIDNAAPDLRSLTVGGLKTTIVEILFPTRFDDPKLARYFRSRIDPANFDTTASEFISSWKDVKPGEISENAMKQHLVQKCPERIASKVKDKLSHFADKHGTTSWENVPLEEFQVAIKEVQAYLNEEARAKKKEGEQSAQTSKKKNRANEHANLPRSDAAKNEAARRRKAQKDKAGDKEQKTKKVCEECKADITVFPKHKKDPKCSHYVEPCPECHYYGRHKAGCTKKN